MTTNQAIKEIEALAGNYISRQGIVWGTYSSRKENGVKVQSFSRTYHYQGGSKRSFHYDASSDEIYE